MNINLSRVAFVCAIFAVVVATWFFIAHSFHFGRWGNGLGGGFGFLAFYFGGKVFDRIWPASEAGWSE